MNTVHCTTRTLTGLAGLLISLTALAQDPTAAMQSEAWCGCSQFHTTGIGRSLRPVHQSQHLELFLAGLRWNLRGIRFRNRR